MKIRIHRDGLGTIAVGYCLNLLVWGSVIYMTDCLFVRLIAALLCLVPLVFLPFFFRVPRRNPLVGDGVLTSVADGEVVIIQQVYEPEYLKCDAIQISVFMSFFNVHVNYFPASGEVTYYKYHPGKYLLAFKPKASEVNERSSIAMLCEGTDKEILFRQIAGTFARRIVTYAEVGDKVNGAEQCGLIKFGSRIDMFIPLGSKVEVQIGDKVRACETVLARLS